MALAIGCASVSAAKVPSMLYQTHVQNVGWQDYMEEGEMSGTEGMSYRLEGIKIDLDDAGYDLGIHYQTHIQNIGWEEDAGRGWKTTNQMSGTERLGYRLEAIQLKLIGTDADKFDVYYQVHAQNMGWLGWAKNGESAGTAAYGYRLEGIKIVIVPAGVAAPEGTVNKDKPFYQDYLASYSTIINEYSLFASIDKYDKTTMTHINCYPGFTASYAPDDIQVCYLLEDFSGDGIPELIISHYREDSSRPYNIVDTYKLIDGNPQRIFDIRAMGERSIYHICENHIIRCKGSGGAGYSGIIFYRFEGTNRITAFQAVHNQDENPEYYTLDENNVKIAVDQKTMWGYFDADNNYSDVRPDSEINWIEL